jgi:hypothetical protein
MRTTHHYITSDSDNKRISKLKSILDSYSHTYVYKEDVGSAVPIDNYFLEFYLYEDRPNFSALKEAVSKFDVDPQIYSEYEKSDIDNAAWFVILTGAYQYPQPEDDFGYRKATFDLRNYCNFCGIGKKQNAPFRLKTEPKQMNKQFWGLNWEFEPVFVREEAKRILEKEHVKGIQFDQPVLHKSNKKIESFYQLHIDKVLDGGFDSYNTKTITCKYQNEENLNTENKGDYCGRIKFHHPLIGGYKFDKTVFDPAFDIVQSHEYFGSGGRAGRIQIVTKRIKQLIGKYKLKGLYFIPIMHERFTQ